MLRNVTWPHLPLHPFLELIFEVFNGDLLMLITFFTWFSRLIYYISKKLFIKKFHGLQKGHQECMHFLHLFCKQGLQFNHVEDSRYKQLLYVQVPLFFISTALKCLATPRVEMKHFIIRERFNSFSVFNGITLKLVNISVVQAFWNTCQDSAIHSHPE